MIPLNTLDARPVGTSEGLFFFSGIPIELKPQETGTFNVREPLVSRQDPLSSAHACPLLLAYIGWTRLEALDTRLRLRSFEEDWNAPGMEGYDEL